MLVTSFVLIFLLFIFPNSLFYSLSLILFSSFVLIYLVTNSFLSLLVLFMFLIVYLGAIIILIGYICAISPNLTLKSSWAFRFSGSSLLFFSLFGILYPLIPSPSYSASVDILSRFFYSSFGIFILIFLILCLFLTLLIVTSQFLSPKGPFRAINSS